MLDRKIDLLKDPYDKDVVIGSKVAYNYQGEVRIGTVTGMERWVHKWRGGKGNTSIKYKISIREQEAGYTSQISHPKNLVVLE